MESLTGEDWIGFAIVLLFCLIPLVAVTIVSWRSRRQGWWLGVPWALFLVLTALMIQLFHSIGLLQGEGELAPGIAGAAVVGAWLSLSIFLIALAIAGPKLPTLAIRDVF